MPIALAHLQSAIYIKRPCAGFHSLVFQIHHPYYLVVMPHSHPRKQTIPRAFNALSRPPNTLQQVQNHRVVCSVSNTKLGMSACAVPGCSAHDDVCILVEKFSWEFMGLIRQTRPTTLALSSQLTTRGGGYLLIASRLHYSWMVRGCRCA
jgi:hypothetical protein